MLKKREFFKKCVHLKADKLEQNGAILFAVVGGKMSEGINFSDELGRYEFYFSQRVSDYKTFLFWKMRDCMWSTLCKHKIGWVARKNELLEQKPCEIPFLVLTRTLTYNWCVKPKSADGKLAGQQYYEGLCWKAINQSIGRAIRHQNDYATILLIDSRYCSVGRDNLKEKLPKWICDSFKQENATFDSKKIYESLENVILIRSSFDFIWMASVSLFLW